MKVDFNKDGMTINFEKVPRFIYINEDGLGVGQVYFDGVRRKGLQKVKIEAKTSDAKINPPLKYKIQYVELNSNGEPQYISNMDESQPLMLTLKLDLSESEGVLECIKEVVNDTRISEELRDEYNEKFESAIKHKLVIIDNKGRVIRAHKEEESHENK